MALKSKDNRNKKRNPLILAVILVALFIVLLFTFCLITQKEISGAGLVATFKNGAFYAIYGALIGAALIYLLFNWRLSEKRAVMKENDLSDSHWLTDKEIKRSKAFEVTTFDKLGKLKDGVPFRADIKNKKTGLIYLKKPIHGVILGTTGTGKTTGYLDPTIQIMASYKTKPCLIVTDPKGELYRHHKKMLEEHGYTVSVIDYRNPYQSTKINPFQPIINRINEINSLIHNEKGKYIVGGEIYKTYSEAEQASAARKQVLYDEIFESTQDLVYTLFPVKSNKDPAWEEAARDFICGLCLLFVDDVISGVMPIEKLCLINVYQTITLYCDSEMSVLKQYFEQHKENVKAYGLAKAILVAEDKTLMSYNSTLTRYASMLADGGIQCMTSGNELSLDTFDTSPNAIFLVFPDEKEGRHTFVSLFIVQTYKELVNRAAQNLKRGITKDEELQRNCYFLLDEFGNLPKINKFEAMTSVGRSRKLFFLCVIQSYAQLDSVYGKESAEIIKGQLQIKIFLGTDDKKTVEEFSWLCGKKKTYTFSANVGIGKDASDTYAAKEQPLITTEELMTLNNADDHGNAIISFGGYAPLQSKFTPAYEAENVYTIGRESIQLREAEVFDEKKFVCDIARFVKFSEVDTLEATNDDVQEMNAASEAMDEKNLELIMAQSKKTGLLNSIKAKLEFIKDYIPEDLYKQLLQPSDTAGIDKFLETYDGLSTVRFELCYIKTLIMRLHFAEEKVCQAEKSILDI